MTLVRFIKAYSPDWNFNISYELVDDELYFDFSEGVNEVCYNTKLLGLVPIRKLEEADEMDVHALDIIIKLSNL